jgi:uncharacterized damage-inducible protein DinB
MTEIERIVDQYDRVMNGAAWHGDPVWKLLDGVSAETAARSVTANTHSIWQLVMHMMYWESVACRRLMNVPVEQDSKLNFPETPEATAANWRKTLKDFRDSNEAFRKAISQLDAARLDAKMARDKRKSSYVEAHGIIQHHVYHAGQIALLKKAFAARAPRNSAPERSVAVSI